MIKIKVIVVIGISFVSFVVVSLFGVKLVGWCVNCEDCGDVVDKCERCLCFDVCVSVVDCLLNGCDFFCFFVWDFYVEFVFESYY